MKTLKVLVRDEFYEEIREEAHSRRISMAEVVRGRLALAEGLRFAIPPAGQLILGSPRFDKPRMTRDVW